MKKYIPYEESSLAKKEREFDRKYQKNSELTNNRPFATNCYQYLQHPPVFLNRPPMTRAEIDRATNRMMAERRAFDDKLTKKYMSGLKDPFIFSL